MRKNLRKIIPILIFMIMCLTILTPAAMAAENPSLEISVSVALSGTLPTIPEDFSIKLTADEMSNPMPEGSIDGASTMIVTGENTGTFPKITYTRVGKYNYTIEQKAGSNPDCLYDNAIYSLTVVVTNADEGGLEITAVVYKDGETKKRADIVFNNSYANPASFKLRAQKTLDGETPMNGDFIFQLSDEEGTILQTKTNSGQDIEFDELLLNELGKHVYYLREKKGIDSTILYDDSEYKVEVMVTKNSEGNYEASVTYMKDGLPFTGELIFANESVPGELPDTGGKEPEPDKPETGQLPSTGEAKSMLPLFGVVMILGGVTISIKRKTKI